MFKLFEKNFEKWEAKKRAKLGEKKFLTKYIRSYQNYGATMKVLLPLVAVIYAINAVLFGVFYAESSENHHLMISITWSVATLLWVSVTLTNYLHRFKFFTAKVGQ